MHRRHAATIDWGDGTATSSGTISDNVVSGTHTYATKGTYFGTVTLSGGNCTAGADATDTSRRTSAAPAMFTQCPPVDHNTAASS